MDRRSIDKRRRKGSALQLPCSVIQRHGSATDAISECISKLRVLLIRQVILIRMLECLHLSSLISLAILPSTIEAVDETEDNCGSRCGYCGYPASWVKRRLVCFED